MSDDQTITGPGLDRLVAERVLGHQTRVLHDGVVWDMTAESVVSPYSTSIAAAWTVVERARAFDAWSWWDTAACCPGIQPSPIAEEPATRFRVKLWFRERCGDVSAETFPLAICRAALSALDALEATR